MLEQVLHYFLVLCSSIESFKLGLQAGSKRKQSSEDPSSAKQMRTSKVC